MASTQNDSLRPLHILEDGQGVIDPDTYFQRHSAPKNLAENESRIREFVNFHLETDRRVVLVTVYVLTGELRELMILISSTIQYQLD